MTEEHWAMSTQELVSRTDELTDTVRVLMDSFPRLRAEHRPHGTDWYRWVISDNANGAVVGVVGLDAIPAETMPLREIKVLLRRQALGLMLQAA
jgi:hypothetical protein